MEDAGVSVIKIVHKMVPKIVFNLECRVEVGSVTSITGRTFYRRRTLLKKKCGVIRLEDL